MRGIVATIQAEQDEIIRLDHPEVLVIEGGPGTGKTVVALHRVILLGVPSVMAPLRSPAGGSMSSTTPAHTYQTNTELYSDPNLVETVDYARRYRRQGLFDDGLPDHGGVDHHRRPARRRDRVRHLRAGMGGHLELSGALRAAMFGDNTRPRRKDTTTEVFWAFVAACRNALARLEAGQVIL